MTSSAVSSGMLEFIASPFGQRLSLALRSYFRATLEGAHHLPRHGAALIVGNHAPFGIDSFVLVALLAESTGRYVRFVGERELWKLTPVARFFEAVGALRCGHEPLLAALAAGEWVGVYPGGIDESLKPRRMQRRLVWGERAGFARIALRAKVPIIPIAGVGIDETYHFLLRERFIGRRLLRSARYDIAIGVGAFGTPLPRRAKHRFIVCPAIMPEGEADDDEAVWCLRSRVHSALQDALSRA